MHLNTEVNRLNTAVEMWFVSILFVFVILKERRLYQCAMEVELENC